MFLCVDFVQSPGELRVVVAHGVRPIISQRSLLHHRQQETSCADGVGAADVVVRAVADVDDVADFAADSRGRGPEHLGAGFERPISSEKTKASKQSNIPAPLSSSRSAQPGELIASETTASGYTPFKARNASTAPWPGRGDSRVPSSRVCG